MNKQLKFTGKKDDESAGKDDQIIDLEDVVDQKISSPDQNEGEVLDLIDEISSNEQENLETEIVELTKTIPQLPDDKPASNNIIHLAEMSFTHNSVDSHRTEELFQNEIVELHNDSSDYLNYKRDDQLSDQLESTIADSFGDGEDIIEALPDANLIDIDHFDGFEHGDIDDIDDDLDDFDLLSESESKLLSESEPDSEYGLDSIDVKELDDNSTFEDYGNALSEELEDLPNFNDDDTDEDFSEAALALNRAMEADRDSVYQDDEEELNEGLESIRSKLDNVFPEDDSQDPLTAFNPISDYDREDKKEDADDSNNLILQPFDEDEFGDGDVPLALDDNLSEAKAIPLDGRRQPKKDSQIDAFAGDDHLYDTENMLDQFSEEQNPQDQVEPFNTGVTVSRQEIERAVQRVFETKYSKKIEQIIIQTIEKNVVREIAAIKKAILNKSDPFN